MQSSGEKNQRTVAGESTFSGIGIHTGEEVNMRFCPAPEGTGIVFRRTDLGASEIPATLEYVVDTNRSTTLGHGDIRVHTVEHVLSAIRAFDIDNIYIDVDALEPPVANGSAEVFVEMIERSGLQEQGRKAPIMQLKAPVYWTEGDVHLVGLPGDGLRISYTLHYPHSKVLQAQYYSILVDEEKYKQEIAPCRTFSLYEEVSTLIDRGLIRGGSLSNSVVIKDDVILSKKGLKFPNEMVRHKVLDLIGDLALIGYTCDLHVIAIRSGHAANCAFAQKVFNALN